MRNLLTNVWPLVRKELDRAAKLDENKHCPTCVCGRRAPVQAETRNGKDPKAAGTIEWAEHEKAWAAYSAKFGRDQTAQRIADRGGFGYWELTDMLGEEPKTWVPAGIVAERERY